MTVTAIAEAFSCTAKLQPCLKQKGICSVTRQLHVCASSTKCYWEAILPIMCWQHPCCPGTWLRCCFGGAGCWQLLVQAS